jgi:hypothetical protein
MLCSIIIQCANTTLVGMLCDAEKMSHIEVATQKGQSNGQPFKCQGFYGVHCALYSEAKGYKI